MDEQAVHEELGRARAEFRRFLDGADVAELRGPSNGTRWNNRQLLFHMLLGYLVVRVLLGLVRVVDRLPAWVSRGFAELLNAVTVPFDWVNYAGARLAGTVVPLGWMVALFDWVVAALDRRLDRETDADLARGMHYPTQWDPFFQDYMTLADVYRFPTQHFDFHARQLTLEHRGRSGAGG
ncbi:MAG TPA: DinB family protein [Acidimicrobiales bacterium]|nr:DinB family protein [Acidimicrobiales bacterium]